MGDDGVMNVVSPHLLISSSPPPALDRSARMPFSFLFPLLIVL